MQRLVMQFSCARHVRADDRTFEPLRQVFSHSQPQELKIGYWMMVFRFLRPTRASAASVRKPPSVLIEAIPCT